MYVDNRQYYGHLVNNENFNTERLHGDMYEIFNNEYVSKGPPMRAMRQDYLIHTQIN